MWDKNLTPVTFLPTHADAPMRINKGLFRLLVLFVVAHVFAIPRLQTLHAQVLTANPGTIYFGDMSVYQSGITRELAITNTGNTSIQVFSMDIEGQDVSQFYIESGPVSDPISPGSTALFYIRATPTPFPTRYMEARLEIRTNSGDLTVPLHSTARLPGVYYVSPFGDNANPGTSTHPWQSVQHAVDLSVPQDTIYVDDGLYEGPVVMTRSGEPEAYITLKSMNKWGAKIAVNDGEGAQDGIKVAANYITVDGFELYDADPGEGHTGNGVTIYHAHHVNVLNNKIHDFGGSGVQGAFCDHVLVENNVVYENAKYNPTQSSGISIWQPWAVDDAPGYHIIVRNNRSFGNITITKNSRGRNTDGTGIIIDRTWDSKDGQSYPHRTLVENNLVYDNGGSGIHLYRSSHVDIINNTSYHNRHNEGITGSWRGELYNNNSRDTIWRNNIAFANPGSGVTEHNRAIFANNARDVVYENNITYSTDIANTYSLNIRNSDITEDEIIESNLVGMNPRFKDAPGLDFSLRSNSPAIDAGSSDIVSMTDINYLTRTVGPIDIGAFEYFAVTHRVELASFDAFVTDGDIEVQWATDSELNSSGFAVELRATGRDFEQARFVRGQGTTSSRRSYATTIQDLSPGTYALRLKKVGIDGTFAYSESIEAVVETVELPVELTSFDALIVEDNDIRLRWTTASELNNAGFDIELRPTDGMFNQVAYVEGQGTTNIEQVYETTLSNLNPGSYSIRLRQIDFDGTFAYSDILDVTINSDAYHLAQSYPNPFNPHTQIPYTIPIRSRVTLEVFDLLGRSIQLLVDEEKDAGTHTVRFDGQDLSNGTYVYRLTAGPYTETRTMVLMK